MLDGLELHFVKTIREVVDQALEREPVSPEESRAIREAALAQPVGGTVN
jgi:hypothetical protein